MFQGDREVQHIAYATTGTTLCARLAVSAAHSNRRDLLQCPAQKRSYTLRIPEPQGFDQKSLCPSIEQSKLQEEALLSRTEVVTK